MSRKTVAEHVEQIAAAAQIPIRMLLPPAGKISKHDMRFVKSLFRIDHRKQRHHWHRLLHFYHKVNRNPKSRTDGTVVAARIIKDWLSRQPRPRVH